MDYKKAYMDALERAQKGLPMDEVFLELKKTEDERIRKEIIDFLTNGIWLEKKISEVRNTRKYTKWIAYLEKQKEQKLTKWDDKDLPQGGESVMTNRILHSLELYRKMLKDSDFEKDYIKATLDDCLEDEKWLTSLETSQNFTEWSEEDETYLQDALWCIEQAEKVTKDEGDMGACWSARRWLNNKLKSLRPQPQHPEIDLEEFTDKIKTFQGRYKYPEILSIKGAMAFMARMFYQYPNVARLWYEQLPKATMD